MPLSGSEFRSEWNHERNHGRPVRPGADRVVYTSGRLAAVVLTGSYEIGITRPDVQPLLARRMANHSRARSGGCSAVAEGVTGLWPTRHWRAGSSLTWLLSRKNSAPWARKRRRRCSSGAGTRSAAPLAAGCRDKAGAVSLFQREALQLGAIAQVGQGFAKRVGG